LSLEYLLLDACYDHISAAICAAQPTLYGAGLICYITPAEHPTLPKKADVTRRGPIFFMSDNRRLSDIKWRPSPRPRNFELKRVVFDTPGEKL